MRISYWLLPLSIFLLLPLSIFIQEFGPCTRQSGSQPQDDLSITEVGKTFFEYHRRHKTKGPGQSQRCDFLRPLQNTKPLYAPKYTPKIHPESSPETKYEKLRKIDDNPRFSCIFRIFFALWFRERIRGVFWGALCGPKASCILKGTQDIAITEDAQFCSGARREGRTLRKGVFLPGQHLLSVFYDNRTFKNPSKNLCPY